MDIFEREVLITFIFIGVAHVISRYFWGRLRPADVPKYLFASACAHAIYAIVFAAAAAIAFWF